MNTTRRTLPDAGLAARRRRVLRVEVTTGITSVVIGGALLLGDRTMQEISVFLFGLALGCALHLTQTVITTYVTRRRQAKSEERDAAG